MKADSFLQEDLDYIANSELPFEELYHSTILVTGATGLVGSQTIKALLNMNQKKNADIKVLALVRNKEKAKKTFEGYECEALRYVCQDLDALILVEEDID